MFNIISILIGIIAGLFAMVGIIPFPFVPMLNWIAFPIAAVGAMIGLFSRHHGGRNLNLVIMLISGVRLYLTWGFI